MAAYSTRMRPDFTFGRVDVPDVGGIFLDFADRQMKQHQIGLDNVMQQAKMEEDRRRYETELGFKQRQEQRVTDELNRAQATREGVLATLDPKAYQGAKIADMENQMRAGLANLSPQDRAEAEKQWAANFNRGATGEYVNRLATTNANVDPNVLLSAQVSMQNKALNDPTSELYKARQQAEWDADKKKMDYQSQKAREDAQFRYNLEQKKKDAEEKVLTDYTKSLYGYDPYKLIKGEQSTVNENGVINQKDIDTFDARLKKAGEDYVKLEKDYLDKVPTTKTVEVVLPNPGSSIRNVAKKEVPMTLEERVSIAQKKAYNDTIGKINLEAAPVPIIGKVEVPATPDQRVLKSDKEQMNEKVQIVLNSGLKGKMLSDELARILPPPKTGKEKLELDKLAAEIENKKADTNKTLAETKKGFSTGNTFDIPKDLAEKVTDKLGSIDGSDFLDKMNRIATVNNLPFNEVYKAVNVALDATPESSFYNVDEGKYEDLVNSMLKQKYGRGFIDSK